MSTPKYDELQQLATDLQVSLDAKQDQIATKLAADKQTIADLQAIIDGGTGNATTDEQLQVIVDSLKASKADLEGTSTE